MVSRTPGQTLRPRQPQFGLRLGLPVALPGEMTPPQVARLGLLRQYPAQRQHQGGQ
ncbi:hypothetical protein [Edwardsiella hoshinae]|uniref:hypothetical protein n=1 Tax=Edwardsiella hoshinae TaxID=93378 RepID=UPI001E522195|nr:hypothetical protein [Edwardsiella hoshinae]